MRPEDLSLEPNPEQNLECQKGAEKTIKFVLKQSSEFKELLYIPKHCEECSLYKDQELRERIIGLKLQTPYSYLLLEGCNTDRVCEHKNVQLFLKPPN